MDVSRVFWETPQEFQGAQGMPFDVLGMIEKESWPTPIAVTERLPIDGDDVLVSIALSNGFSYWTVAFFSDDSWWVDAPDGTTTTADECVTHWLPLPPNPEGE